MAEYLSLYVVGAIVCCFGIPWVLDRASTMGRNW
jgi:hypothetical protein